MFINKRKLKMKRYSSGELKLIHSELNSYIENNFVEILFLNNDYSFFELLIIIDYYISNKVIVNLILSYLPYQRMDHKGRDEVATLTNVANILNCYPINHLTICEPHSEISDFKNAVKFSLVETIKDKVFKDLNYTDDDFSVVFTDKGAKERYKHLFGKSVYFNKARNKETGLIEKHEIVGELKGKTKVLIVDDIISTGDTIINIVDYLTKQNVKEIFVLSGHFEKNKYNKRLFQHKNVVKVYSTNSLTKKQNRKLKLFDIKELIYG